MAGKPSTIVYGHDVYKLTAAGEDELRGSRTALAPAQIELLVRIDGKQTASEIAASCQLATGTAALDAFRILVDRGLVRRRAGRDTQSDSLDFTGMFDAAPAAGATRGSSPHAEKEVAAGVTTLQKHGYFVRIARQRESRPRIEEGAKPTVIVVEDEALLAKFLRQYLSFDGFNVRVASNREEILAAFRAAPPPNLVLLDVVLPDADGFNILHNLRAHPALKNIPVIMITAKASRESVLKGLAGGADGYITKPFEPDALLKAVRTVLGMKQDGGGAGGPDGDVWIDR